MQITFWGAAGTVTGSRFVVDTDAGHRLLVDCGMFQGLKELRARNWQPFPVDPATIDAVVLTHAHIDHSGFLPALVRDGFSGPIWSTPATAELCQILLLDAAHLQEEDARHANLRRSSKHEPALPLYTTDDAKNALILFEARAALTDFEPVPGVDARFSPVGHILGASCVRLADGATSVLFTGDVGRPNDPIMNAPLPPPAANYVVTESTYGNRPHSHTDPEAELADVIGRTMQRGGSVLIPVFAVGRAQTILHLLRRLRDAGRIPHVPTYLNSPMAVDATDLFCSHPDEHHLSDEQCAAMCDGVQFVRTADESREISGRRGPQIVLAASGMASGGRVLHHLETLAPDPKSTIVLVGFQAAGTRGRALQEGASTIRLFGQNVPVRAEVTSIDGLSAHVDADELVAWLRSGAMQPRKAFVVHGEPSAAEAVGDRLHDELGWSATVARHGQHAMLS